MEYTYNTVNTCAKVIKFNLDGDIITDVRFLNGGCPGNLQALPRLVNGMNINDVIEKLEGINCGVRGTSCADQLVCAIKKAKEEQLQNV